MVARDEKVTGRCLCGDVAYEVEGKVSPIWLCHCSKCRRASGSAFHAATICRPEDFRFTQGESGIRTYQDTPGHVVHFCGRCGSPVPCHMEEYGFVMLHAGGLDGDLGRKVDHHIFTGSKASWYDIEDGRPQFEERKPPKT